jgi:hypothetical protein
MGSDGLFVQHNGSTGSGGLHIPSGLGGGCIASGPFAKYVTNCRYISPAVWKNQSWTDKSCSVNLPISGLSSLNKTDSSGSV